jgi:hypothetical protein
MKFVYTVWLRELKLPPDDPDYEWPACFVVDGATEASAQGWGDHLAERYARTHNQAMMSSSVELVTSSTLGIDTLPVVQEGHEATDTEIGW